MDTTPDMLPKKIYVNLKCAITLENKQLSIWEVVFMTKSLQNYLEVFTEGPATKPEVPAPTQAEMEKFYFTTANAKQSLFC